MAADSTTLNISLPTALKAFVEEQVEQGAYTSTSEYVRELLRAARRQASRDHELEVLLLQGVESGALIEADQRYWNDKAKKLSQRWPASDDE